MKYKWLNRKDNKKLIVFFNGWGMDEAAVKHLEPEEYDVIMLYDYNNLDMGFGFAGNYQKKYLIAWSMGVMCASLFDLKYESATAVNGTLKPIDNEFGIPLRIYDLTLRGLTPASVKKFVSNMFKDKTEDFVIKRDFDNIKNELAVLKTYSANLDFHFNRIIISSDDKIIPGRNQTAFWGIEPNIDAGHCPFFLFKSWSELL